MSVLVFGGSGFLGSHLVEALSTGGTDVIIADVQSPRWTPDCGFSRTDVCEREQVLDLLEQVQPSAVVNLAGVLGTAETFDAVPRTYQANVIGAANVLDACNRTGSRYVGVMTGTNWPNPYAASKRAATDLARVYAESNGLPVTVLRVFNAYGPRQSGTGRVAKIVPRFIKCLRDGVEVPINGDGRQHIDLVPANFVAQAFQYAVSHAPGRGEIIDVGTGAPAAVATVAERIAELMGMQPRLTYLPRRHGEGTEYPVADTTNMAALLGISPPADPYTDMQETIEWYLNHKSFLTDSDR